MLINQVFTDAYRELTKSIVILSGWTGVGDAAEFCAYGADLTANSVRTALLIRMSVTV